jgi:putative DNA primase/helicase
VHGRDEGVWRRLRLVPWEVTIPDDERDDDLAAKLRAEAPGILRYVVEGARIFLADGLRVPEVVRAATDRYRADEDLVGRFIADALRIGEGSASSARIRSELERWAAEQGIPVPDMREVAPVLANAGCMTTRRTMRGRKSVIWLGVSIPGARKET